VDRGGAGNVDQRRYAISRYSYGNRIDVLVALCDDTAGCGDGGCHATARSSTLDDERFVAVCSLNTMSGCSEKQCGEREQRRNVRTVCEHGESPAVMYGWNAPCEGG
jgi:hypothetical protein